ncbi:MAG: cytochrome C oxidase subunit IV family protein [Verrucomicrobia bacterium]|nr:cytochrome C oxidase subunit IV family protein [Verrucomicrobiota bacterium]
MAYTGQHVTSIRTYVTVFLCLMALTALTVWVAFMDLGFMNTIVAMTIAVIKALLVVLIFMHLKDNPKVLWIAAGGAAVWLAIMMSFTLADYLTRPASYLGGW